LDARTGLLIALYVVLIVLCGTGIWALVRIVRAADATRRLAEDLDGRLIPLIEKASMTVDSLNVELERVDGIVAQLEEVSDTVSSTTRAAQGVMNAPVAAIVGLSERARRFTSILFGRRV
jgi:hypothetical protein